MADIEECPINTRAIFIGTPAFLRFKFFLYTKEGQTLLANRGSYKTNIGAATNEEVTKYLQKQAERGVNAAAEAMGFGKNFNAINGNIAAKFVCTKRR